MADWVSIKAEYISTGISLRDLAKKHGVSFSSLGKKSSREHWKDERTETGNKVETKVKQKLVAVSISKEVDRITRLLNIGDSVADKLTKATQELGTYAIIKRKSSHTIINEEGQEQNVEDTVEIAEKADAVINTADLKRIASTLKDILDVAKAGELESGEEALQKAREILGGVPSVID